MVRFLLLIFVWGMMGGFSPNIEVHAAGSQPSCDSLENQAEAMKSDRALPLASVMSQLRSCREPGSSAYTRTYAWEARVLYQHGQYPSVLSLVESMRADSTADGGATFSYVNEYAGLAAYRSNHPHKAYHHFRVAIQHGTDRPLEDQTNLLRTLAINLLQAGKHAEAERTIERAFRRLESTREELSRLDRAQLHLTASGITVARLYAEEAAEHDLQGGKRHLQLARDLLQQSAAPERYKSRILALSHQARYAFADDPQRLDAVHRVLDRALDLAQSHGYAWGRTNTMVSRARIHLHNDDPEAALSDLKQARIIARAANLHDLQPLILHHQVDAATELNRPALAIKSLNALGGLDSPVADQHYRQASLTYASRFSTSPHGSWISWLGLVLGGGLLVGGGVIAGTHLARTDSWRSPASGLYPASSEIDSASSASGMNDTAERTDGAPSKASSSPSTSPSIEYVDTSGASESLGRVVRQQPSDASSIAREVPWFRDPPSEHPLDAPASGDVSIPEDPEDRSREHRRLLFGLWGLPPYGTQEAVGLPAYLEDGTSLGYRSVTADQIQRALGGRLFLRSTREGSHQLFLLLRGPTCRALSPDDSAVPPATVELAEPIQGVALAELATRSSDAS